MNITLESFIVSEEDMKDFESNISEMRSFMELFEETFGIPINDIEVISEGARAINIFTRVDTWMMFDADTGNDLDTLVEWIEDKVGPVSSVQLRCN